VRLVSPTIARSDRFKLCTYKQEILRVRHEPICDIEFCSVNAVVLVALRRCNDGKLFYQGNIHRRLHAMTPVWGYPPHLRIDPNLGADRDPQSNYLPGAGKRPNFS
jgi:hypothetical protein